MATPSPAIRGADHRDPRHFISAKREWDPENRHIYTHASDDELDDYVERTRVEIEMLEARVARARARGGIWRTAAGYRSLVADLALERRLLTTYSAERRASDALAAQRCAWLRAAIVARKEIVWAWDWAAHWRRALDRLSHYVSTGLKMSGAPCSPQGLRRAAREMPEAQAVYADALTRLRSAIDGAPGPYLAAVWLRRQLEGLGKEGGR